MANIDFSAYLDSRMAIVVIGLIAFGGILKAIKTIKDEWILYILLAVGIAAGCLFIGPNATGVVQGVIAVAVAVFGNQLFKQAEKASATNSAPTTATITYSSGNESAKTQETNAIKNSAAAVDQNSGNSATEQPQSTENTVTQVQ